MNETTPVLKEDESLPLCIDQDVVVAYADDIEYHRFVKSRCVYEGLSKRPAAIVFKPGQEWSDLEESEMRKLLSKGLTNRSIWIRNPSCGSEKGEFVMAVKGTKDRGGILFDEIFKSQLLDRAKRLNEAFCILGLKSWSINVLDDQKTKSDSRKGGRISGGVEWNKKKGSTEENARATENEGASSSEDDEEKLPDYWCGGGVVVNKNVFEDVTQTLKQTFKVKSRKSASDGVDLLVARQKIAALGLQDDQLVSTILSKLEKKQGIENMELEFDFSFTELIRNQFHFVSMFAGKILFVSFSLDAKYRSFCETIKIIHQNVKITIED